jgi:hypothetical protein
MPAPVRGRVPVGVPGDLRVAGAAAWVPDALWAGVGGVDTGGGEALTFGVFSHGGHGAWYSPLPLGGDLGGDCGGDQIGPRVVGVLRLSGVGDADGDGGDGGDGDRDRAWNDPALPTG